MRPFPASALTLFSVAVVGLPRGPDKSHFRKKKGNKSWAAKWDYIKAKKDYGPQKH